MWYVQSFSFSSLKSSIPLYWDLKSAIHTEWKNFLWWWGEGEVLGIEPRRFALSYMCRLFYVLVWDRVSLTFPGCAQICEPPASASLECKNFLGAKLKIQKFLPTCAADMYPRTGQESAMWSNVQYVVGTQDIGLSCPGESGLLIQLCKKGNANA